MIAAAVAAFLGAFAALVVMAECSPIQNKLVRYACAFLAGILLALLLGFLLGFVARAFAQLG